MKIISILYWLLQEIKGDNLYYNDKKQEHMNKVIKEPIQEYFSKNHRKKKK